MHINFLHLNTWLLNWISYNVLFHNNRAFWRTAEHTRFGKCKSIEKKKKDFPAPSYSANPLGPQTSHLKGGWCWSPTADEYLWVTYIHQYWKTTGKNRSTQKFLLTLVIYFCSKVTLISDKWSSLHLVTGWQRGEDEQSLYRKHLTALREHFKQPHIHKTISKRKINKKCWESKKMVNCQDNTLISWGKTHLKIQKFCWFLVLWFNFNRKIIVRAPSFFTVRSGLFHKLGLLLPL